MASQTVFVHGASGFNATWDIQTLLQRGFDVVVSVRSRSKGEFLQSLFGPTYGQKFSYIITPSRRRPSTDSGSSDAAFESSVSPLSSPDQNYFRPELGEDSSDVLFV